MTTTEQNKSPPKAAANATRQFVIDQKTTINAMTSVDQIMEWQRSQHNNLRALSNQQYDFIITHAKLRIRRLMDKITTELIEELVAKARGQ